MVLLRIFFCVSCGNSTWSHWLLLSLWFPDAGSGEIHYGSSVLFGTGAQGAVKVGAHASVCSGGGQAPKSPSLEHRIARGCGPQQSANCLIGLWSPCLHSRSPLGQGSQETASLLSVAWLPCAVWSVTGDGPGCWRSRWGRGALGTPQRKLPGMPVTAQGQKGSFRRKETVRKLALQGARLERTDLRGKDDLRPRWKWFMQAGCLENSSRDNKP